MKSVCFVGNYAHYSGALEVFRNIALYLRTQGIRTAYVYHKQRPGDIQPDMRCFDRVEYVPDTDYDRQGLGQAIAAIANSYDVVHTSLLPLQWRFCFKAACTRPMVETYHSPDGWAGIWPRYKLRMECGAEKPPAATVAVSRGLAERIRKDSGIPAECIYNGVRVPREPAMGGPYVTYCGRLAHDKGLDEWLKIAVRVREEVPWARFQWVGQLSPNYDEFALRCLQVALPWLEITGFTDPAPYYQRSACLLLTSPSEGLPMCILEAMAHGIPSVCYPAGDIAETGATLAHGIMDAVAKVVGILQMPPEEGDELADYLHREAYNRFKVDAMGQKYQEVYQRCISQPLSSATN